MNPGDRVLARVRGATRTFQGRAGPVTALSDVSLDIRAGRLLVVGGPSGGGKSTLLNLIGLLDRPDLGEIEIEGEATGALGADGLARLRRRVLGHLFQDAGLIPRMSAGANVALPLMYQGVAEGERRERVAVALEAVGLGGRGLSRVEELSGGERHRVGLARALASAPVILVCDEPTASLDAANGETMVRLLRDQVAMGRAVVCSSHDPRLLSAADDRVILVHGRVTQDAPS